MLMVPSILQLTDDEIYDVYRNELGRLEDTSLGTLLPRDSCF